MDSDNYGKFFEKLNKKGFLHFKANQNICDIENYSKLKVELSDGSFSRTMKPIMDDYINQGKIARASNEDIGDGYIEEMLGINYSNIAGITTNHLKSLAGLKIEKTFKLNSSHN